MTAAPRPLRTREDLLGARPGDWLLRQLASRWADDLPAYALGTGVALWHLFGDSPEPVVVGGAEDAAALARMLLANHSGYVSLPRAAGALLVARDGVAEHEGWAFRRTAVAPALPIAGEVSWLSPEADGEVAAFLAEAFPDASLPVGHPDVRRWAGLRRDERLVAVAADATAVEGLGFLASIASHPAARGTGAGAAVTAWTTAELVGEHGACGLWHMGHNAVAAGLYTRLGYSDDDQMAVVGA